MLKVDRLPAKATFGSMSPSRIISREKSFDVYLKVTTRGRGGDRDGDKKREGRERRRGEGRNDDAVIKRMVDGIGFLL
eukprot:250284-Hanusia_phi.AAC.1